VGCSLGTECSEISVTDIALERGVSLIHGSQHDHPCRVEDVKCDNSMVGHVSVRHFCTCLSLCSFANIG